MSNFSMKAATTVAVLGGIVASAVSASAALNLPTMSCSYMFNTNMKLGSRGADVMNLQKVLNMYPQTRVAESGAGSPGMETSTFGPATRAAVNKFQALHLVELGITTSTGNVFAGTRGLLNMVCSTTPTPTPTPGTTPTTGPVSAMLSGTQPTGMIVSGQSGARLADITFTGNGTVTSMQLQRIGVSADSALTNVYLYDGNTRISDAASVVTGGYINFNSSTGLFTVNGTRTLTVRADIAASTNGQSVGVKLNSVTAGGAVSTFTNVMGNQLTIASVTTAAVNFSTVTVSNTTVNAGTINYNVWEGTANVSTRNVNFRAATFKFVGSAPVDALANLSLFIDGTKVAGPSMINAANNNKVTFDLGMTPYLLTTGAHIINLRGDVVKGSNRTMTFSVENVSDLMFEDSQLAGVNVSATVGGSTTAMTQSNSTYRTVTVNSGSVTVTVDPAFTANKVTGGATNVPVAQFTLKAYGEDVKVNTLAVTPTLSGAAPYNGGLPNVSLYMNGGQVGTSQNWTSGALSYTLGSSLIIPAGQTVTLTVKADVVNATSSSAYTAGTVTVAIGDSTGNNAQGQSSNEIVSVANPSVSGNTLTISSGAGTFASTAGFVGVNSSPNIAGVKIGSYTIQANSAEAIKINTISASTTVSSGLISNYSNLTLKTGSTVLGTPVGNPSAGTTTFSFSDITIPANGTQTFDLYADLGGDVDAVISTAMGVTYRGAVSNTTTTSSANGIAITSLVSSLTTSTLSASSPVAQFVVGGSTFGVATFTLKTTSSGMNANVRELRFSQTGTNAIESITVGGVTAPVVSGTSTVTGLNIAVSSTGTDVPVTVKYSGYQNTTSGGSLSSTVGSTKITLTYVEATSGSGTVISNGVLVDSNTMTHVASKPTVTGPTTTTGSLVAGTVKIGEFTVAADANGKIAVATTSIVISTSTSGTLNVTNVKLSDDGGATAITYSNTVAAPLSGTAFTIGFTTPYEISAGTSKTFSIYATVAGGFGGSGASSLSTQLDGTLANFLWKDVIGGNTSETGAGIRNFGVGSYTLKN